ncbi:TRPT1 [Mytilus coruscus]|uniref:TRPT1 n=1 Tax=Mytilus coruscus TaxID=42192 RepID=A0A6J8BQA8_MYTCO|nr:TRPT1 [Mytilus coruscus]
MKLGLSVVESVPQARKVEVAILGPGVDANLPRDREGNGESRVSVGVRAGIESEQSSNSDEEATPSGGLDRYLLKTLATKLRHGALELGHRLLPDGHLLVEDILIRHPGFAGYSLPDIHKLIKVDVDKRFTLIKNTDSDVEVDTTLVEEASDEEIVTVCQPYQGSTCPTPVVDGGMTDNYEKGHTSLTFWTLPQRGAIDRKATTEDNSPIYKETVIIVESFFDKESSLSLGVTFKADNVGTRYFNLQPPQ